MRKIVAIFEEANTDFWSLIALCDDQSVWRTTWDGHNCKWQNWHQMPLPPIPQPEEKEVDTYELT
jgi:hypothetical protein